jgi:hypothetical protein
MATMPIAAVLALIVTGIVLFLINGYIPIPASLKKVLNVVLGLIVVGIGLWLVNTYIPMAPVIKAILNIVVVIATCVGVHKRASEAEKRASEADQRAKEANRPEEVKAGTVIIVPNAASNGDSKKSADDHEAETTASRS